MDFTETDMVAHHVRMGCTGGMGLKPSDYRTIPLTAYEHFKLHQGVEKEYYDKADLDVDMVMKELLEKYLRDEKGIVINDDHTFDQMELLV